MDIEDVIRKKGRVSAGPFYYDISAGAWKTRTPYLELSTIEERAYRFFVCTPLFRRLPESLKEMCYNCEGYFRVEDDNHFETEYVWVIK